MKHLKLRNIALLIAMTLMISLATNVSVNATEANETIDIDFNNTDALTCNTVIKDIVYSIISHNADNMNKYVAAFSTDTYTDITNYIANNNIEVSSLSDITVDYIYPDKSSTGDTVIMANAKAWNKEQTYNMLYLFEFHVNSVGDIYGYNVWVY